MVIDKEEKFVMKKKFKLVDLDCANCAAKMEGAIKKIDGVNDATVSFLTQKLTLDAQAGGRRVLLPPETRRTWTRTPRSRFWRLLS